jgi:uncharacterized protein
MSRENVELVRRMCAAFATRDWDAAIAPLSEDVEWDAITHGGWPDGDIGRGREAVQDFFRRFFGAFDEYDVEFERFFDVGDHVLVDVRDQGRGKGSGVLVERVWAQVWTMRGGEVVRFEAYRDRQEARAALGLPTGPEATAIERWVDLWNDWDVEGMMGLLHPDVEIEALRSALEDTSYRGHEGARRFFSDSEESWQSLSVEPGEITEVGGRLVTTARLSLLARESHVPVEQDIGFVWEFEDGLIRSVRTYLDPSEAYEAAAAAPGYSAER